MYIRKRDLLIGTGCIFGLGIILFVRSFFSFCWSDEALYMAEVHRLYLGDSPLVDEWHPTQFFAVLLLPFYTLYMKVNGDAEGIYLVARIFALLLSILLGEFTMWVMRKKQKLPLHLCVSAGMLTMLYSRANVGGPSYHNLFFFFFFMGVLVIYNISGTEDNLEIRSKIIGNCIIAGILLGMAIVCNPIFFIFYFLWAVYYCIYIIYKKDNKNGMRFFSVFLGTLLVGIVYLIFLFSKNTFMEVVYYLPFVLGDDMHKPKGIIDYIGKLYELFYYYAKFSCFVFLVYLFVTGVFKLCKYKFPIWMKNIMFFLAVMCLLVDLKRYISSHMGAYVAFSIFGINLCFIEWEKVKNKLKDKEIWCFFILPAIGVILTFAIASATGDPMTEGFVILSLVTLVVLSKIADKRIYRYGAIIACAFLVIFVTLARVFTVYRDAPLHEMSTRIEEGPAKGLLTTKDHAEKYIDCLETMEWINLSEYTEEDTIIISRYASWMYTATNIRNGAPHPYNLPINSSVLEDYYKTHTISQLKFVLILDDEYGDYEQAMNPEGTYDTPNKNELGGDLWELLNSDKYEKMSVPCGVLYQRKDNT